MTVTPHLSPIKENALCYKADAPGHNEPWYCEYCGMANWLLTTGPDITPGSTLLFRGRGHVTFDHEAAAEHMQRLHPRAPRSRHHVRRTVAHRRLNGSNSCSTWTQRMGATARPENRTRVRSSCSTPSNVAGLLGSPGWGPVFQRADDRRGQPLPLIRGSLSPTALGIC